jgi:hypothetical protein
MGKVRKKHYFIVILSALVLFSLTSLFHKNSICCMFSSIRSYGFPGQFVTISKETDSLKEAQKVNTLSTPELLKQGWQMKFGTEMASPISLNTSVNVVVNILLCLIISFFSVLSIRMYHKKYET